MTSTGLKADTSKQAGTNAVKVMIVDDSAVVRGLVARWIDEEAGIEIVARHANGELAVKDVATSKPDIVLLDIEMPVMDGLTALPQILKAYPKTKVIMASTLTRRNAEVSIKALSLGAIDYVPKPESNSGITTSTTFKRELIDKVKAVSGISQFTNGIVRNNKPVSSPAPGAKPLSPINKPAGKFRFTAFLQSHAKNISNWQFYWRSSSTSQTV